MRVFISYAWENDEYRALVKRLAARLIQDGIDARLDAWHLQGLTIPEFMSREVRHADKVLVVCSPQYRQKVHAMEDGERITGTGWESMLVTSSIWANVSNRNKITPVLLRGTWQEAAPDTLIGLPYFDLSNMATFEANYRELLRRLTGQEEKAPMKGAVPEIAPEPVQPLRGPQSEAVAGAGAGAFQIASGIENREHAFLRALYSANALSGRDRISAEQVNGIGELFQISPSEVLVLVERLQSDGLLSIHWGGQVSFTTKGRDYASGIGGPNPFRLTVMGLVGSLV
jgi:TIR domain